MKRPTILASVLGLFALAIAPGCSSSSDGKAGEGGAAGGAQDGATRPSTPCTARELAAPGEDFFVDISASSGIQKGNFDASPPTPIPINDHSRLAHAGGARFVV